MMAMLTQMLRTICLLRPQLLEHPPVPARSIILEACIPHGWLQGRTSELSTSVRLSTTPGFCLPTASPSKGNKQVAGRRRVPALLLEQLKHPQGNSTLPAAAKKEEEQLRYAQGFFLPCR